MVNCSSLAPKHGSGWGCQSQRHNILATQGWVCAADTSALCPAPNCPGLCCKRLAPSSEPGPWATSYLTSRQPHLEDYIRSGQPAANDGSQVQKPSPLLGEEGELTPAWGVLQSSPGGRAGGASSDTGLFFPTPRPASPSPVPTGRTSRMKPPALEPDLKQHCRPLHPQRFVQE